MLHLVLGKAGTGKSTLLLERLEAAAGQGEPAILLVPEQYSFEAERQVHRVLGPKLALGVEVLSFTRLCNSVFRACGGLAGTPVTPTGRLLLMSLAVEELKDTLRVYRKSCNNPTFLQTLLAACAEFKTAGLRPQGLEQVVRQAGEGHLRDKLEDLAAVYQAYQALLEQGYSDPEDDLIRAVALLGQGALFEGSHIFVDGFATFMAGEFALLDRLMAQSAQITFAFTADGIEDAEKGVGVFSTAKGAIRRLLSSARKQGVEVAPPVVLDKPRRYQTEGLAHLAEHYLQGGAPPWAGEVPGLELYHGEDVYRELEQVAGHIAALVREEGYRYRDIAVVARETAPYQGALESVFWRGGIPFFANETRDVETLPLGAGLAAALEAVRSNLDSEAVLAYAKSPIAGFGAEQVAALENYCYIWGVRGKLWESDWKNHPRGLVELLTDEDEAALAELNATRRAIVEPLLPLRGALAGGDGRQFAGSVYRFLQAVDAPGHLAEFAQGFPQGERETCLAENSQLWDALMEILDIFGQVLGSRRLPPGRMMELFRLALGSCEVGLVPQTLDQVLVGKADRIRPGEVKAVFVVGAVEGLFPAEGGPGGLFTDDERRQMIALGAEIGAPSLEKAVLERYFCYNALTLASHRLYVSTYRRGPGGESASPSLLVTRLEKLFPGLLPAPPEELVDGGRHSFDLLARHFREDTPQTAALLAHFAGEKAGALARMEAAALKRPHAIREEALARELFGKGMTLSPTRVERYHHCAFAYFAQDGLKLKPRVRVEFNPLESGSIIHHVLQVMVQQYGRGLLHLSRQEMAKQVREIIDGYLAQRIQQQEAASARFLGQFRRLTGAIVRLLRHLGEELAQSEYIPTAFELPIRQREGVPPLELVTASGIPVRVEGYVDRVDVMEKGKNRYIRVVDYKSGGKDFRLDDVLYGLNLQMLLYLFTIAENGKGELAGGIPGGVLYLPVHAGYISAGRDAPPEAVTAAQHRQWKMSGLLLDDPVSLRGMEKQLAGVFIPAKLRPGGEMDSQSALAGKAEMGRLARKIKRLIADMAESLSQGKVPARPVSTRRLNPCDRCDYAALCGFEPGDEALEVPRLENREVFRLLEEEEDGQKLD